MLFVVDCGASSTKIAVYNSTFKLMYSIIENSIAYTTISHNSFINQLLKFISSCNTEFSQICVGSAGLGEEAAQKVVLNDLSKILTQKLHICSDAELAMWNTLGPSSGLVLILGTGSIFYGRNKNTQFRYSGYGYLFDSISGAFTLVRNYLSELLKHEDNGTAKSEIAFFCEAAKVSTLAELVRKTYKRESSTEYLASFAKITLLIAEAEIASVAREQLLNYCELIAIKSDTIFQKEKLDRKVLHITGGLLKNTFFKKIFGEVLKVKNIELNFIERENTFGACEMLKAGVF